MATDYIEIEWKINNDYMEKVVKTKIPFWDFEDMEENEIREFIKKTIRDEVFAQIGYSFRTDLNAVIKEIKERRRN